VANCPLCAREMAASIDKHHLIPKLKGGRNGQTVMLHKVCHAKIHSLFTEPELARTYSTIEKILEHEEIQKFVGWVSKKHAEFYESSKETGNKKNKRRK